MSKYSHGNHEILPTSFLPTQFIDLIKRSEYVKEWRDYDNWNGGIDFYNLQFYLNLLITQRYMIKKPLSLHGIIIVASRHVETLILITNVSMQLPVS